MKRCRVCVDIDYIDFGYIWDEVEEMSNMRPFVANMYY